MKVDKLRKELGKRSLSQKGVKKDLTARLKESVHNEKPTEITDKTSTPSKKVEETSVVVTKKFEIGGKMDLANNDIVLKDDTAEVSRN
jgi:hypothetical protein